MRRAFHDHEERVRRLALPDDRLPGAKRQQFGHARQLDERRVGNIYEQLGRGQVNKSLRLERFCEKGVCLQVGDAAYLHDLEVAHVHRHGRLGGYVYVPHLVFVGAVCATKRDG
jgi:hypothetical protein